MVIGAPIRPEFLPKMATSNITDRHAEEATWAANVKQEMRPFLLCRLIFVSRRGETLVVVFMMISSSPVVRRRGGVLVNLPAGSSTDGGWQMERKWGTMGGSGAARGRG
mmetsp:Transcript_17167/g.42112  ORF Transcript_17167/g.42112 Transcript_17167/m.42112 type:complete len:109 (+) Transcript_17167:1357-1683(+)